MDEYNTHLLSESTALARVLLDANILIYSIEAFNEIGIQLLDYLEGLEGYIDWYVASCVAYELYKKGTYPYFSIPQKHMLNCDSIDMKMDQFPYIREDDSLGFVKLNSLAGDDWAQIGLAHNFESLIVATNDSKMFKSAHASLEGRAIAFHDLLNKITLYYPTDKNWAKLKQWFETNKKPLRNNSSWIIKGQKVKKHTIRPSDER